MNLLLDTHTLLWLLSSPTQLDAPALATISDPDTRLWVSAASAWEVAIKTRLGRLDGEALLSAWAETVVTMGAAELAIDSADAILAGRLPWTHKDPFDRVLVAQSLRRGWTIATRDSRILDAAIAPTLRS